MKYCPNCGQKLQNNQKFCPNCGAKNDSYDDESVRKQKYAGTVIKCPNCGAEIPSLTAICPNCGHEIVNAKTCESLTNFASKINECDLRISNSPSKPKKGWSSWSSKQKTWWIVANFFFACLPLIFYYINSLLTFRKEDSFTAEEKEKSSYIKNATFPNERETILEILLYINNQMDSLASEKVNKNTLKWMSIWKSKAVQLYTKAEILFAGDVVATNTYNEILSKEASAIKKYKIRSFVIIGAIVLFFVICLFTGEQPA